MREEQRPDFYDVRAGSRDEDHLVHRFPATERGRNRADAYREAYNTSLRKGMGVTDADLDLGEPDFGKRPGEYERAELAHLYRSQAAYIRESTAVPVVGDDAPMPTEYPHGY